MVAGLTGASGGRGAESVGDLLALQGRCKRDPEGYENELVLQLRHFDGCLPIFLMQPMTAGTNNSAASDPGVAKEMADMAMFLAHMTPLYPQHLGKFPTQLLQLLKSHGATIQTTLRRQLTQALVLLRNRKVGVRCSWFLFRNCLSVQHEDLWFWKSFDLIFFALLTDD